MKLEIPTERLIKALQFCEGVCGDQRALSLLKNVLFEAKHNHLNLTTTNLELTAIINIPATTLEKGKITIPIKKLIDIVKSYPNCILIMELKDKTMEIKSLDPKIKLKYKIYCAGTEDFPDVGLKEKDSLIVSGKFLEGLKKCIATTAKGDSRYFLNSIQIAKKDGEIIMVSTDTIRLTYFTLECDKEYEDFDFLLPSKTAVELLKSFDSDKELELTNYGKLVEFKQANRVLVSNLLNADYPDWKAVIPPSFNYVLKGDTAIVKDGIDRLGGIVDTNTNKIIFKLDGNVIGIEVENMEIGSGNNEISLNEGNAKEMSIGFNYNYIKGAIDNVDSGEVEIHIIDNDKPVKVVGSGVVSCFIIVMPTMVARAEDNVTENLNYEGK